MRRATPRPSLRTLGCALAAAAAATAAARGAAADTNRNELSFGGQARALRSSSANAVTGDNLAGVSVGAARDLGLAPLPRLSLWAEAGLTTGTADGTLFQTMATELNQLGLTGGLAARYQLHRLITASARVAVGAERARLHLAGGGAYAQTGQAWGAAASAGAALDLFAASRPPFGIGIRLELGYVAAQAVGLAMHRDGPGPGAPIALDDLMLGHLDLGGPRATLSLLGQF